MLHFIRTGHIRLDENSFSTGLSDKFDRLCACRLIYIDNGYGCSFYCEKLCGLSANSHASASY